MRIILRKEILSEMPNSSALGAFNSAVDGAMAFGTPSKFSEVNRVASNRLLNQANKFDKNAKNTNSVKQMNIYKALANKRREAAFKIANGR